MGNCTSKEKDRGGMVVCSGYYNINTTFACLDPDEKYEVSITLLSTDVGKAAMGNSHSNDYRRVWSPYFRNLKDCHDLEAIYINHLAGQSLLEEPIVSAEMAMGKVLGATEVEWRTRRTRKMVFEVNFPAEAQPRPHIQPWWGWQGEAG